MVVKMTPPRVRKGQRAYINVVKASGAKDSKRKQLKKQKQFVSSFQSVILSVQCIRSEIQLLSFAKFCMIYLYMIHESKPKTS